MLYVLPSTLVPTSLLRPVRRGAVIWYDRHPASTKKEAGPHSAV